MSKDHKDPRSNKGPVAKAAHVRATKNRTRQAKGAVEQFLDESPITLARDVKAFKL